MLFFKLDVYVFGMIIFQFFIVFLVIVLMYKVEIVMGKNDEFIQIFDKKVGDWLMEEICKLVVLVFFCIEICVKDRFDFEIYIFLVLESFKNVVVKLRNLIFFVLN